MAKVSISTPAGCSPKPPITTDLSIIEEGKATASQASTVDFTVSPTNAPKIIAELLGTYVIIFTGCCSVIEQKDGINIMGVALAWGLAVMVMIYSQGHVSGGHFNPAVTIAFAASGKFPWREVPAYVAAQSAGSTLAILTLDVMFHSQRIHMRVTLTQYHDLSIFEAFLWEFIISFILMLTICGVAVDSRAINELSGVTVGATVLFNILIAGNITGASMNPARSIGPALVSKEFKCLWIYIVSPILGMITATMMYSLLWIPTSENFDKENTNYV